MASNASNASDSNPTDYDIGGLYTLYNGAYDISGRSVEYKRFERPNCIFNDAWSEEEIVVPLGNIMPYLDQVALDRDQELWFVEQAYSFTNPNASNSNGSNNYNNSNYSNYKNNSEVELETLPAKRARYLPPNSNSNYRKSRKMKYRKSRKMKSRKSRTRK